MSLRAWFRRANERARHTWNNPTWTPYDNYKAKQAKIKEAERKIEQNRPRELELAEAYERFQPVTDLDGTVWARTLTAPPPWSRERG